MNSAQFLVRDRWNLDLHSSVLLKFKKKKCFKDLTGALAPAPVILLSPTFTKTPMEQLRLGQGTDQMNLHIMNCLTPPHFETEQNFETLPVRPPGKRSVTLTSLPKTQATQPDGESSSIYCPKLSPLEILWPSGFRGQVAMDDSDEPGSTTVMGKRAISAVRWGELEGRGVSS